MLGFALTEKCAVERTAGLANSHAAFVLGASWRRRQTGTYHILFQTRDAAEWQKRRVEWEERVFCKSSDQRYTRVVAAERQ